MTEAEKERAEMLAATKIAQKFGMVPYRLDERAKHPPFKAARLAADQERAAIVAWLRGLGLGIEARGVSGAVHLGIAERIENGDHLQPPSE